MKILYCDFLLPLEHSKFNTEHIKILSSFGEVVVLTGENYIDSKIKNTRIITKPFFKRQYGKRNILKNLFKVMFVSAQIAKDEKPDFIIISTYETRTFAIGQMFFKNNENIYLIQHNNVDLLSKRFYRFCFNTFKNKFHHIVFEKYIADFMQEELKISSAKIHIIPHPCYEVKVKVHTEPYKYDCISVSFSNNENIIEEIVAIEKKEGIIKKAGKHVVLKSKIISYDNGYLKIVNRRFTDEEYNDLFENTKMVYLPFQHSYRFTFSGNMADAFSHFKIVIATDILLARYYSYKYPSICNIIENPRDVLNYIAQDNVICTNDDDFVRFKNEHSLNAMSEGYRKILYNKLIKEL